MVKAGIVVQALTTPHELAQICRLSAATFGDAEDSDKAARRWQRRITESPAYHPGQWRGAFCGGRLLGGYIMHERLMRSGLARLPTGCIGAVVTDPDHRLGGVGRALMTDAIQYARGRNLALLLLDGIPDFYHRFGYVDVFDLTEHHIARPAIAALPESPYRTRPVRECDAAAVLGLYQRQYGHHTGSFDRDPAVQQHQLRDDFGPHSMVLALDGQGRPRGYLEVRRGVPSRATEVTAEDWPAILALLHAHERLVGNQGDPGDLRWPLPLDSPILPEIIDRLALPDTSRREHITTLWSVESRTYHHRDAGWLARPANINSLLDSLLPLWRDRWAASSRPWRGSMTLDVDGDRRTLLLGDEVRAGDWPQDALITLTGGSFVQLVFGYRTADYLATRDGNRIPEDLIPVLHILFPVGHAWIPGTDAF